MIRIGLLSDTHITGSGETLPVEITKVFRDVDLILHAGDIYVPSVLDYLELIAPVLAAKGDDDHGEISDDKRVKYKHVLELEGKTLWLVHELPPRLMPFSARLKANDTPDIIVFGHDHRESVERSNKTLFINPGSPIFLNYQIGLGTVGMLTITSNDIDSQIIWL